MPKRREASEETDNMASPQRKLHEIVEFPADTPVEVALKYPTARQITTDHGERAMFSLVDGRVMFLDLEVAGQIEAAGLNVRERFTMTRHQNGGPRSTWEITRLPGEQPNGTYVVPKGPETTATKRPQRATASISVLDEANTLVDTYAAVLERALQKHQGRVKPDEVRALLVTAYIQRAKLSSAA